MAWLRQLLAPPTDDAAYVGDYLPSLLAGVPEARVARVMIDGYCQPPAERPALREREWPPSGPEAADKWNHREIDVPNVIRPLGSDDAGGDGVGRCWVRVIAMPVELVYEGGGLLWPDGLEPPSGGKQEPA